MAQCVKNLPAVQEAREMQVRSLVWENVPGEGHGNPLQYSCLENPKEKGAWWATVLRVTKSHTQVKQLSVHAHPLGSEEAMGALKKVDVVFVFLRKSL